MQQQIGALTVGSFENNKYISKRKYILINSTNFYAVLENKSNKTPFGERSEFIYFFFKKKKVVPTLGIFLGQYELRKAVS